MNQGILFEVIITPVIPEKIHINTILTIHIKVLEKLSQDGMNITQVSMSIRNQVAGMTATLLREEGEEYDIIVRLKEQFRNSISDINHITIVNPLGQRIKLSELAHMDEYWSPPNIDRKRRERLVTVTATPSGVSLGVLAESIQAEIAKMDPINEEVGVRAFVWEIIKSV
jgi:multidrug efflux pump subunit AcrB